MKNLFILFLGLMIVSIGCRKDSIIIGDKDKQERDPSVRVNSSVFGMLVDGNRETIEASQIQVKDNFTFTDSDGFFIFKDILMNENGATIKAKVPGYFTAYKVVNPQLNQTSSVLLSLLKKTTVQSFSSQKEFLLSDVNGASAMLPAESVVDNSLNIYNGMVSGAIRWISPNEKDFMEIMPGQLIGQNSEGINIMLKTFGMLVVELHNEDGQMLFLDQNETVELHYPVPQNMLGIAPADIPLWYFDEDKSLWVENGVARLENNMYVGRVNQLGYWTCNATSQMSTVKAKIKFENDFAVSNFKVQISNPNSIGNKNVMLHYSDNEGMLIGNIPADEILELSVFSSCEDEIFYKRNIGPYASGEEVMLDEIIIKDEMIDNFILKGVLYDCNLNPIKNGYVKTVNQIFPASSVTDDDGNFEITGVACTKNEVAFKIFDLDNHKNGQLRRLPFNEYLQTGNIVLCENTPSTQMEISYLNEEYNCTTYLSLSGDDPNTLNRTGEIGTDFNIVMIIGQYKGVGEYAINGKNVDLRVRLLKNVNGKRRYIAYDEADDTKIIISSDDGLWVRGNIIGRATRKLEDGSNKYVDEGVMSVFFQIPRYIE